MYLLFLKGWFDLDIDSLENFFFLFLDGGGGGGIRRLYLRPTGHATKATIELPIMFLYYKDTCLPRKNNENVNVLIYLDQ